ncbi:MAG: SRPBCC domain-containing protein [bacterium]
MTHTNRHRPKKSLHIKASISDVWEALTNPEMTVKYFFNCEAISDWKVGSLLLFKTIVEGEKITVVKGVVTAIEENALLEHTCYSAEFEHEPSKHTTVTYKFSSENGTTRLSVTQGRFEDEETCRHNDASWDKVLDGLKTLLEAQPE